MSKTIKLNIKPEFDFTLIAIISSEPIYRLSWLLNEKLSLKIKESSALKLYHNKRQLIQEFSMFKYIKNEDCGCYLIQNRGNQGLFIEEHKMVDYWLRIDKGMDMESNIFEAIKEIKNINLAFEVKPGSLKSKLRFIFSNTND